MRCSERLYSNGKIENGRRCFGLIVHTLLPHIIKIKILYKYKNSKNRKYISKSKSQYSVFHCLISYQKDFSTEGENLELYSFYLRSYNIGKFYEEPSSLVIIVNQIHL